MKSKVLFFKKKNIEIIYHLNEISRNTFQNISKIFEMPLKFPRSFQQ